MRSRISRSGAGSMGIVYKARHLQLDRVVALKMIAGRSSQISALFQIEAKAVAQLQHPNIVQIFELGHYEGQPFLALEFVEEDRSNGRSPVDRYRFAKRPSWSGRWRWRLTTRTGRGSFTVI